MFEDDWVEIRRDRLHARECANMAIGYILARNVAVQREQADKILAIARDMESSGVAGMEETAERVRCLANRLRDNAAVTEARVLRG